MLHLTRRWLLERMGLKVSEAISLAEVRRLYDEERPGLLVICHTIHQFEYEEAVWMSRFAEPEIKILRLTTFASQDDSLPLVPTRLPFENPATFTKSINALLHPEMKQAVRIRRVY